MQTRGRRCLVCPFFLYISHMFLSAIFKTKNSRPDWDGCFYGAVSLQQILFVDDLRLDQVGGAAAVQNGDTVVITAGVPLGRSGSTNLIKAQIVNAEDLL